MGHLGARVSALLDGQLPPAEAERAWAHVHACHACRDLVEREGWVKTRLATLSPDGGAPDHLKGSLLGRAAPMAGLPPGPDLAAYAGPQRRPFAMVALGGSAAGAAVLGVLALGVAPADGPIDRRPPTTSFRQSDAPRLASPTPPVRRSLTP